MEPLFKQGEIVYERIRPGQQLIVKNNKGLVYDCQIIGEPHRKLLTFFERDLIGSSPEELSLK